MKYVNEFLNFKCAPDILAISGQMKNWPKEISEAMAIRKWVKEIVLKAPDKWVNLDLCSGNALVPLLNAFSLPLDISIAVDKQERKNLNWSRVKGFHYYNDDIFSEEFKTKTELWGKHYPIIFTAAHACKNLATKIIELYNQYEGEKQLILMPCCIGKYDPMIPEALRKMSDYEQWCYWLYNQIDSKNKKMTKDTHVISPRNIILRTE